MRVLLVISFAQSLFMMQYFSNCAGCGFSLPPIYYLCEPCWQKISLEKSSFKYTHLRWPAHALWEWETKGNLVHKLLQRRKGGNIYITEKNLALRALEALPQTTKNEVDEVFFPQKWQQRKDHTWYFAHAIGEILTVPVTGLQIHVTPFYKSFGRSQRARERSKNTRTYAQYKGQKPLLVDDIITTGATLEALWVALRRPEGAVSLCLAYKTFNPEDKI